MPDNAFIENFNGKFRAECLNAHWFLGLEDAREKLEAWRRDYNELRPHSAIGNKPRLRCTTLPAQPARQERNGSKTLRPDGPKLGSTSNWPPTQTSAGPKKPSRSEPPRAFHELGSGGHGDSFPVAASGAPSW